MNYMTRICWQQFQSIYPRHMNLIPNDLSLAKLNIHGIDSMGFLL